MKFKALALAAVAMACSFSAFADGYNRVNLSYDMETVNPKVGDNTVLNGFGISYIHGFGLTPKIPLYLEIGGKLSATFGGNSGVGYKIDDTFMNLQVPVNVVYKYKFGNGMAIAPYLGINFKFNVVASEKYTEALASNAEASETINLLKSPYDGNAFQIGWHIGAGFYYRQFYIGLGGGTDFNEFMSNVTTGNMSLTLGYTF